MVIEHGSAVDGPSGGSALVVTLITCSPARPTPIDRVSVPSAPVRLPDPLLPDMRIVSHAPGRLVLTTTGIMVFAGGSDGAETLQLTAARAVVVVAGTGLVVVVTTRLTVVVVAGAVVVVVAAAVVVVAADAVVVVASTCCRSPATSLCSRATSWSFEAPPPHATSTAPSVTRRARRKQCRVIHPPCANRHPDRYGSS